MEEAIGRLLLLAGVLAGAGLGIKLLGDQFPKENNPPPGYESPFDEFTG
jgi:hypothetical protein